MPVSLLKFKDYCEMTIQAQAGQPSRGIVTVRRADILSQNIIPIPLNTVFSVSTGQSFKSLEVAELNESQEFIPLFLESVNTGLEQNIPATSEWNTPIAGISLVNAQAFVGGEDPVLESNIEGYPLNRFRPPSDSVLNLILSQAQKVCLGIAGLSSAPDTPTFEAGVYFLGRYYLETRTKKQSQIGFSIHIVEGKFVNQGIEDTKVHDAVMRILTGMLTADREVTAFMPEVENESS